MLTASKRLRDRTKEVSIASPNTCFMNQNETHCNGGLSAETKKDKRARLENYAAIKRLSLAIEMEEEGKVRLEKMVTTTRLRLAMDKVEERTARLEKMVYHKAGWPGRQRKNETWSILMEHCFNSWYMGKGMGG